MGLLGKGLFAKIDFQISTCNCNLLLVSFMKQGLSVQTKSLRLFRSAVHILSPAFGNIRDYLLTRHLSAVTCLRYIHKIMRFKFIKLESYTNFLITQLS